MGILVIIAITSFGNFRNETKSQTEFDWQTFDSPDGEFSALFPGKVKTTQAPDEGVAYGTTVNDEISFGILTLRIDEFPEYHKYNFDKNKVIESSIDGLVRAMNDLGAETIKRKSVTFRGVPSVDLEGLGDGFFIMSKTMIADGVLYTLSVTGVDKYDREALYDKFIYGFELR